MSAVLLLALLIQSFVPNEFSAPLLVLIGLSILTITMGKPDVVFVKMILPLLVLFLIGLHGVFNHESRHILRDVVFATFPIALLFIGYWIGGGERMRVPLYKLLILSGCVLAINHLAVFIQSPELLFEDLEVVRETAGKGTGGVVVIGLLLATFRRKFQLGNIYPKFLPPYVVLPVLVSSFILSYSRTEFLMFLVAFLALSGVMTKIRLNTILVIIVSMVVSGLIVATTPDDETGTLRSKFSRSITELTVTGAMDDEAINNNWRAFETKRALMAFESSNIWEQSFGQGFGALVDIGIEIKLGTDYFREIPIFHNGYVYVLVKTGFVGVLCYLLFYIYAIRLAVRSSNSDKIEQRFFGRLLLGSILSLILMMTVVGGMAETAGGVFVVLVGYLVRRIVQYQGGSMKKFQVKYILKAEKNVDQLNLTGLVAEKRRS